MLIEVDTTLLYPMFLISQEKIGGRLSTTNIAFSIDTALKDVQKVVRCNEVFVVTLQSVHLVRRNNLL